jgi:hypothetical protein
VGPLLSLPLETASATPMPMAARPTKINGMLSLCAARTPAGFPGANGSAEAIGTIIKLVATNAAQKFRIISPSSPRKLDTPEAKNGSMKILY